MTPPVLVAPRFRWLTWCLVAAAAAVTLGAAVWSAAPPASSLPVPIHRCVLVRSAEVAVAPAPPPVEPILDESDCRAALAARKRAEVDVDGRGLLADGARAAMADRVLASCLAGRAHADRAGR